MRSWLAALSFLAACDSVFGVDHAPAPDAPTFTDDAAEAYDRCAPAPALDDDPLRRVVLGAVDEAGWSWETARAACLRHGMDLAVLNDARELGRAPAASPFWVGHRATAGTWTAVDGCAPFTGGAAAAEGCGFVGQDRALASTSCDGALPPDPAGETATQIHFALCEAPRPASDACLPNDPATTTYVTSSTPLSRDAAAAFCAEQGARLVEPGSHVEWMRISTATSEAPRRFWIGAAFDGAAWQSESRCPLVYPWTGNAAGAFDAGACAATELATDEDGRMRLDGVAATSCDGAEIYALCER